MPQSRSLADLGSSLVWLSPCLLMASFGCKPMLLAEPEPAVSQQNDDHYRLDVVRKADILFVIDNSGSMAQEQENLGKKFPAFMRKLQDIEGGLPDLRIAVVNTDVGAGNLPVDTLGTCLRTERSPRGRFQTKDGRCGLDPAKAHFLGVDGKGGQNFDGPLDDVFKCLADQGTEGCGYEHQLQAMRAALAGAGVNPENKDFLREDAYLAVVLITDEDDCSADPDAEFFFANAEGHAPSLRCNQLGHVCDGVPVPAMDGFSRPLASCVPARRRDPVQFPEERRTRLIDVEEFVAFVLGLKARPDQILVSAIVGWSDAADARYEIRPDPEQGLDVAPICASSFGRAAPAVRLKSFVDAFGGGGSIHSLCGGDLEEALSQIGEKLARSLEKMCLTQPVVDVRPNEPGLQVDCAISERRREGGRVVDTPLPRCGAGVRPCWRLVEDGKCGGQHRVEIDRDGEARPGMDLAIRCLSCAGSDGGCP